MSGLCSAHQEHNPECQTCVETQHMVLIPSDSILWNIIPVVKENEREVVVELQWGWTAGMSEEKLATIAEDAPTGYDSVQTTLDDAEALRDALTLIIEKNKARHEELRKEWERKDRERNPQWYDPAFLKRFREMANARNKTATDGGTTGGLPSGETRED